MNLLLVLLRLAVTTAKACGSWDVRAVTAENLLFKQQLIVQRRVRERTPNLTLSDRLICGFGSFPSGVLLPRSVPAPSRPDNEFETDKGPFVV
jgi:hypothetical protein